MSKFIFKDLSTKKSKEIEAILTYNLKQSLVSETREGKEFNKMEITNPEQVGVNTVRAEDELMKAFFTTKNCGVDEIKIDELSREEYDTNKQDLLDWATDNGILWVIKLKLCPAHEAITELLDLNPQFNNFRSETIKEAITKWVDTKAIESKMLEKIKQKDKKK